MKAVLIQLSMTSHGSTATMDADRGGGSVRHYGSIIPVGVHTEPHVHYGQRYNAASTTAEREIVLEAARNTLSAITTSSPRATVMQTQDELYDWIVANCEGLTRHAAAVRACTGASMVWSARVARGREPDYGREPNPTYFASVRERREFVRHLAGDDMSARSIAKQLGISYSMVLRDLGQKKR